jgi:hypothetical protein
MVLLVTADAAVAVANEARQLALPFFNVGLARGHPVHHARAGGHGFAALFLRCPSPH